MHLWLKQDQRNICIVHCLVSGQGAPMGRGPRVEYTIRRRLPAASPQPFTPPPLFLSPVGRQGGVGGGRLLLPVFLSPLHHSRGRRLHVLHEALPAGHSALTQEVEMPDLDPRRLINVSVAVKHGGGLISLLMVAGT